MGGGGALWETGFSDMPDFATNRWTYSELPVSIANIAIFYYRNLSFFCFRLKKKLN
jgi:hypothetical protein